MRNGSFLKSSLDLDGTTLTGVMSNAPVPDSQRGPQYTLLSSLHKVC